MVELNLVLCLNLEIFKEKKIGIVFSRCQSLDILNLGIIMAKDTISVQGLKTIEQPIEIRQHFLKIQE